MPLVHVPLPALRLSCPAIWPNRTRPVRRSAALQRANSMKSARWNGTVIAESDTTEVVEGNHYFPLSSIRKEFFEPSSTTSMCPWKGTAKYYNVKVDGKVNRDSAWYYDSPKDAAKQIKDHVAFWKGVAVQ